MYMYVHTYRASNYFVIISHDRTSNFINILTVSDTYQNWCNEYSQVVYVYLYGVLNELLISFISLLSFWAVR